ncbi:hypothetical protein VIBNIAM115_1380008 [Vibrio nigripulchritudo AM115]|nr:hypothetical protein VIBNIAM115_1380008 [Vibrio nigripulchritudo AM115]
MQSYGYSLTMSVLKIKLLQFEQLIPFQHCIFTLFGYILWLF